MFVSFLRFVVKVRAEIGSYSNEIGFNIVLLQSHLAPDDMEVTALELRVTFEPLFQNGVDVWLDHRTINGGFAVKERDDYDPTCRHGVPFVTCEKRILANPRHTVSLQRIVMPTTTAATKSATNTPPHPPPLDTTPCLAANASTACLASISYSPVCSL